jgi:hypothetical protein
MAVLNAAYAPWGFQFQLAQLVRTTKSKWVSAPAPQRDPLAFGLLVETKTPPTHNLLP